MRRDARERRRVAEFLEVSAVLTGFDQVDLQGTGLADTYVRELTGIIGPSLTDEFLSAFAAVLDRHAGHVSKQDSAIAREILSSARLGPVARNIITMWYLGVWSRLPDGWNGDVGRHDRDVDRVISANSYVESLVWRAIDAHPPGARQPGFGSWALPPGRRGSVT